MATMAAGRYCCSYYSPSVLPLQPQRGTPLQLDLQHAGKGRQGRERTSLRVAASAAGGARAEPLEVATDADFFQPSDSRPIMLFDGVCNLCNGGVRFVREHDPGRSIRYIPLQSESGRKLLRRSGRSPDDISSVVLVEKDRFLRDFAYHNVANNRYLVFGRSESEASSPPDGASAVDLAAALHREVVDAVEGQEVCWRRRPSGVWRHDDPVQLQGKEGPLNLILLSRNVFPPGMTMVGRLLSRQVAFHVAANAFQQRRRWSNK